MAAIDFPSAPATNDEFTADGRTWVYDGTVWNAKGVSSLPWDSITGKPATFASDWDTMVDKPSTFTPSAHTQNASTITTTVSDKSANYAILAADKNTLIRSTNSAITITIDNVLAVGESVNFIQWGAGQVTFAAGSGVTIGSVDAKLKTNKQYSGATVTCVASGLYSLVGDLAA